jgi:cyclopropane-fatty-acyl-phospholipid synthase
MTTKTLEDTALSGITWGTLILRNSAGHETVYGEGPPEACFQVHDDRLFQRLLFGGRVALGDTYALGQWDVASGRLSDFLGILLRNHLENRVRLDRKTTLLLSIRRMLNWMSSRARSQRCVASHYDLGNEFFRLFLDQTLTYSCGYRLHDGESLAQLQENKYALICRKLGLRKNGRLLDVGCGWGGLLHYVGECHPTVEGLGITLSARQQKYASECLARAGLEGRMRVEYQDYRDVKGRFDFIASIGMFEHVGRRQYKLFMDRMRSVLAPGGVGVLHTIGITGDRTGIDPWIEARIFPGAEVPCLEDIVGQMHQSGLLVAHVENLAPHYADTLAQWTRNLVANKSEILALDSRMDERFFRQWHYYLQLCEAGFRYGDMQLYQVVFAHEREWPFDATFEFALNSNDLPRDEGAKDASVPLCR